MVVCPETRAAQVGQDIFAKGGNAIDAAVAVAFAQGVTNPLLCGIGGTGTLCYYDGQKRHGLVLNFETTIGSRPVPESWAQEYVGQAGAGWRYVLRNQANEIGYQSVMVPGFVRGCWVAYQRLGSHHVSWADLLAPAVSLAKDGFEVDAFTGRFWQRHNPERSGFRLREKLHTTPDTRCIYLRPDGSIYRQGDWLVQSELGETLQRLADAGGEDFYTGEIARTISGDFARHHGFITKDDLRDYPVDEDQPLCGRYRDLELSGVPFSDGVHIIEMLHVLEHFDLAELGHNTPKYIDILARAQRACYADYVSVIGLTREEIEPLERELVGPERAAYWAGRIKQGDRINVRGGTVDGTTTLVCMDTDHNVVAFTHSIGSGGSGVITPGLGFLYNNDLQFFNPLPGFPDSIVPGKKFYGASPLILSRDGKPFMALGSPSNRSITAIVQCVANVVDHGMDMRTAVSVPRFHSDDRQLIFLEPAFRESVAEALVAKGNEVQRSTYMGWLQAILLRPDTGSLEAGSDPRGGPGVGLFPYPDPASDPAFRA
jgi:gamma-glutamyltranspeptidase/glutathione hydrolase